MDKNSKFYKLHQELIAAEDDLFGIVQGFTPANTVTQSVAEILRSDIFAIAQRVQKFHFPGDDSRFSYDEDNTYCETVVRELFNLHFQDGTLLANFKLRQINDTQFVVTDITLRMNGIDEHDVEKCAVAHIKDVVQTE